MCLRSCKLKVEHIQPCSECLEEWAISTRETELFARQCREHARVLHAKQATDQEWRERLDQVAPVDPTFIRINDSLVVESY